MWQKIKKWLFDETTITDFIGGSFLLNYVWVALFVVLLFFIIGCKPQPDWGAWNKGHDYKACEVRTLSEIENNFVKCMNEANSLKAKRICAEVERMTLKLVHWSCKEHFLK